MKTQSYWRTVMPKIILVTKCNKCEYEEEAWYTTEERDKISGGEVECEVCGEGKIFIMIGSPQFSIKGPGVYDPGTH